MPGRFTRLRHAGHPDQVRLVHHSDGRNPFVMQKYRSRLVKSQRSSDRMDPASRRSCAHCLDSSERLLVSLLSRMWTTSRICRRADWLGD